MRCNCCSTYALMFLNACFVIFSRSNPTDLKLLAQLILAYSKFNPKKAQEYVNVVIIILFIVILMALIVLIRYVII